jgi:hypothetical protein
MIDLLQRLKFPKGTLPPEGRVGLLSFDVQPEADPYLVTSSRGLTWVTKSGADGTVNAAFRTETTPPHLFQEVVLSVLNAGRSYSWGNTHPLNGEGIRAAIAHVRSYVPEEEVTALTSKDLNITLSDGTPVVSVSWLPEKTVVIIPTERRYLGVWGRVSRRTVVAVVQNAARTMAIAGGPDVVPGDSPSQHGAGA